MTASRPTRTLRRPSLRNTGVAVIAIGTLTVSGLGVADAAGGGTLVGGHKNTTTGTTTLAYNKGTPLALRGSSSEPPLTVTSKIEVPHLNANYLGGLRAKDLQHRVTGSCATGIVKAAKDGSVVCVANRLIFTDDATITAPAGITHLVVDLWGAGGGGGGQEPTGPDLASGGGAGAFVEALVTVTPGEKLDISIGRGGAGSITTGDNGGTTELDQDGAPTDAEIIRAFGGEGGTATGCDTPPVGPNDPAQGGEADGIGHAGVVGLDFRDGAPGTCTQGGGLLGYAGRGGDPDDNGNAGTAGSDGLLVITES